MKKYFVKIQFIKWCKACSVGDLSMHCKHCSSHRRNQCHNNDNIVLDSARANQLFDYRRPSMNNGSHP